MAKNRNSDGLLVSVLVAVALIAVVVIVLKSGGYGDDGNAVAGEAIRRKPIPGPSASISQPTPSPSGPVLGDRCVVSNLRNEGGNCLPNAGYVCRPDNAGVFRCVYPRTDNINDRCVEGYGTDYNGRYVDFECRPGVSFCDDPSDTS